MRHLAGVFLLLLLAATAVADSRSDLFRALDLERAEGDYPAALTLYRRAAESKDPAVRAEARLGEARCLRLTGKTEEARTILEVLAKSGAPEKFRAAARAELAKLPGKTEPPPVEPEPPTDPDEKARIEREMDERFRRELAGFFVSQARAFLREVRYDDARERLAQALSLDPTHAEARALFRELGDTPGGRERLIREVLKLLDYERELRLAELTAEADARIAAGEESLRNGELDEAAFRFDSCVRLLDANAELAADLPGRRERAAELRKRSVTRGGKVPDRTETAPVSDARPWRESLRALLVEMASAPPGTSHLRIHDVIPPPGPPAGETGPDRFVPRGRPDDALDLMARVLAGRRRPDRFVRRIGQGLAVSGPPEFQEAVTAELSLINTRQGRPIRLRAFAVALSPDDLSLVHGVVDFIDTEGIARSGTVTNPDQAERFVERLISPEVGDLVAQADLILLPGGSVRLEKMRVLNLPVPDIAAASGPRRIDYGVAFSLLAHRDRSGAIRIAVDGETTGVGSLLRLPVRGQTLAVPERPRSEFALDGSVPEGGAWFVAGLMSPFRRDGEGSRSTMLLIFRVLAPGEGAADAPAPPAEKGPTPVDLGGLEARPADDPSPAFRGEGPRATESREGFLHRHLWRVLGEKEAKGTLTLSHGAVWVNDGEDLLARTRAAVSALNAQQSRLVRIRVRAAVLTTAEENRIASGRPPTGAVLAGEGVRIAAVSGEDLRRIGYLMSGAEGRYPLLRERLYARPTQLVHALRTTRYTYLSGFFPARETSFPVYDSVEEGLAVEVRPLFGEKGGIDLALRLRVARVLDREDPEGQNVRPERPVLTLSEARITATARPGSALLVTGLPAPTPVRDRRERLVLLVEAAETPMPK